jgi:hypothetical protein
MGEATRVQKGIEVVVVLGGGGSGMAVGGVGKQIMCSNLRCS